MEKNTLKSILYIHQQKKQTETLLTKLVDENIKKDSNRILIRPIEEGYIYMDGIKYHYTKKPAYGIYNTSWLDKKITNLIAHPYYEYAIKPVSNI